MNKYMLNNLGNDWIYEAENEEEATEKYISDVCNSKTIEEYESYCKNVDVDWEISWELVN